MKDNEYSRNENHELKSATPSIKSSKFENPSVFSNHFTKYNIYSGAFVASKRIKYASHNGGIPVGMDDEGSVLVDSSDSHTMILGATGSKKSRLVMMPTVRILADAGESMIISDPKSEIYERCSGYLKRNGYNIIVVNFRNPSIGNSWNPLHIPYQYYKLGDLDKAYEFANDIAANLCLAEVAVKDPFWDYSARDLFFGLELLLFKYCYENEECIDSANIANLLRLRNYLFTNYYSSGSSRILDSSSILNQYMNSDFITSSALNGTVNAPEKTQASILSVFDEKMRSFTIQPRLLNLLSSNSIDLDHIGNKKTVVFLIMPDEKTSYHKLVTMFIKQSYEYVIHQAQSKYSGKLPVRVNFLLDEFASLPAIKDFPAMISASRSRNIRFILVVQSKNQLIGKYGNEAFTIQSNCNNWVFLTSREVDLLREISILCGNKNHNDRPLVPMDALQHLNKDKGEALILCGRLFPIISRLPDIKKYDSDQPMAAVLMESINQVENRLDFSNQRFSKREKAVQKSESAIDYDPLEEDEDYDLQKELEKKFDELFGAISDSDN